MNNLSGTTDSHFSTEAEEIVHPDENTPLLIRTRRRSASSSSEISGTAPSFAHTMASLFNSSDSLQAPQQDHQQAPNRFKKYFRPMCKQVYWKSLFHIAVLNFPFALLAWVYLFVFTVTGTTLLITLPLGLILSFINLLGARALAKAEITLQVWGHGPLPFFVPPPLPIFSRSTRSLLHAEEDGTVQVEEEYELSFYKNTYAMFTDPVTYQSVFYFLVIKPFITLLLTIFALAVVIPGIVLILPAPLMLRIVRRLGIWQAGVAVEGLCFVVG